MLLEDFIGTSIPKLNISNVENISSCFSAAYGIIDGTTFENLDIHNSKITELTYIFSQCSNLQTAPNWNTSKITSMVGMFQYCKNLITVPNYDTSNVTNMAYIFTSCNYDKLPNNLDWDISNVEDFSGMFSYTNSSNISRWTFNFSKSKNLKILTHLFAYSYNLTSLPMLNNIDLSNVTNIYSFCAGCNNLSNIDNLNFNFRNLDDISYMLDNCSKLVNIPKLNIRQNCNCVRAFRRSGINQIPITNNYFNRCNCYQFASNCMNLVNIDNITFENSNLQEGFCDCQNLIQINNITLNNSTSIKAFYNCQNLITVNNLQLLTNTVENIFLNCVNLKEVDISIPQNPSNIYLFSPFTFCNNLSNNSIQNIINICLNLKLSKDLKNLSNTNYYSPFNGTKFNNSYYQDRWTELTEAGWTY